MVNFAQKTLLGLGVVAGSALSAPSLVPKQVGPQYQFATSNTTSGSLRYVEDSGVCETTPGVKQYSGYVDIGKNQSMWFWFFEARNNPEKAPFALWLNGGPGCSSMIGLFQEHGPCTVEEDGITTKLNPYSWNEYANMIYVDQPISVGFSYGRDDVNTTWEAAPEVWKFFQLIFTSDKFSKYESREFGFWSESYGGHYSPAFVSYFLNQNKKIAAGKIKGEKINVLAMGVNNGWYDPLIQNLAYIDFAQAKYNTYFDLVNSTTLSQIQKAGVTCKSLEEKCYSTGKDKDCAKADEYCIDEVFTPAVGDRNSYYILGNATDPFPSEAYVTFLQNKTIQNMIGAQSNYSECPDAPYEQFVPSGDDARSTIPALKSVLNTGLRTLIWAGDVDMNCNWIGGLRSIEAMDWNLQSEFNKQGWTPMEVEGHVYGVWKAAGNLTYLRVFEAGHEVPAYQPIISLEVFKQTMKLQRLHDVA